MARLRRDQRPNRLMRIRGHPFFNRIFCRDVDIVGFKNNQTLSHHKDLPYEIPKEHKTATLHSKPAYQNRSSLNRAIWFST
jgi:hypothetical protein